MSDLEEKVYQYVNAIAKAKEVAIELAFVAYFGRGWTETDLDNANLVAETDVTTGIETFLINDKPMIKFSRLNQRLDVEGNKVTSLYYQSIEVLY